MPNEDGGFYSWIADALGNVDLGKGLNWATGYDENRKIDQLNQQAYDEFGNLTVPDAANLKAEQLGPSALEGVQADPAARQAQQDALAELMDRGRSGYTVQDRSAIDQIQAQNAQQEKGQRGAILARSRAQGQGGSGRELAAQMSAAQNSANSNALAGTQIAAQGRQQALQSLMQGGQLAGQVRGQDYGEKSDRAKAADEINRLNAANRTQTNQFNANQGQQHFSNQLQLAAGKSGAAQTRASQYGAKQRRRQNQVGNAETTMKDTAMQALSTLLGGL